MIGLRAYARDGELPGRLGDPELVLPAIEQVLEVVRERLSTAAAPRPTLARLDYARWKPGVASLGVWTVAFEDGSRRVFSAKRYASARKPRDLAQTGDRGGEHLSATLGPFRPLAVDLSTGSAWWSFPADRALRGLPRAVHGPRAARLAQDALAPGATLKKRKAVVRLLRYKPERRAVVALEAPLRGQPGSARLALRVHPPRGAVAIAARRRACPTASELGPRLVHVDPTHGILLEEWLAGEPARAGFTHVDRVAALLARLHAAPLEGAPGAGRRSGSAARWLERVPGLRWSEPTVERERSAWTHGDLHPDQFLDDGAEGRLLDLDELAPGDPARDLASWIADHLSCDRHGDPRAAAGALLEPYAAAGGDPPEPAHLCAWVARELVARAAAGLRRLEVGALDQARELVELARMAGEARP